MTVEEFGKCAADYGKVKPHVRAVFRPKSYIAQVSIPAAGYGFEDLNIVPTVMLEGPGMDGHACAAVTKSLLKAWGISQTQLISDAIDNLEPVVEPIGGVLHELMGDDAADLMGLPMYVVTNKDRFLGAATILKAKDKLLEIFPEGYIAIPSSTHEMIAIDGTHELTFINDMVRQINSTELQAYEVLSDRAYTV